MKHHSEALKAPKLARGKPEPAWDVLEGTRVLPERLSMLVCCQDDMLVDLRPGECTGSAPST